MTSSLYILIGFIGVILVVEVGNNLLDHPFNAYGILPRTSAGLVGIPLSAFLHGSYIHVQSNAVALLALGTLAVIRSGSRFPWVGVTIIIFGGLGVWASWQVGYPCRGQWLGFRPVRLLTGKGYSRQEHPVSSRCCRGRGRFRMGDIVRSPAHQRIRLLGGSPVRVGGRSNSGDNHPL